MNHRKQHMKRLLALAALTLATAAIAGPTLTAGAYAPGTLTGASITVNGGASQACTIPLVAGALVPTCDLSSLANPGNYTLVLTVSNASNCTNTGTASTCTGGGSNAAPPFTLTLQQGPAVPTALKVAP